MDAHTSLSLRVAAKIAQRGRNLPTQDVTTDAPDDNSGNDVHKDCTATMRPRTVHPANRVQALSYERLTVENVTRLSGKTSPIYKNSWQLAGYLQISSKLNFHKVQFSWQLLSAFQLWEKYSAGKGYLSILLDVFPDQSASNSDIDLLAASLSEITDQFPLTGDSKKANESWGLASIIHLVSESFNLPPSHPISQDSQQRIDDLLNSKNILPMYAWSDAPKCDFGPFNNELMIERYNRINLLFHSLRLALSPTKLRDTYLRFPSKNTLFTKDESVPDRFRPTWLMAEAAAQKPAVPPPALKFQPKTFRLHWARKAGTALERSKLESHLTADDGYVEEHGLSIPPLEHVLKTDPRLCLYGAQWRDKVREQLGLWNLRLNIVSLDLKVDEDKHNIFGREMCIGWEEAQTIFNQNDPVVIMRLAPIDSDIEHPIIEWDGPPPELESFFSINDSHQVELTGPAQAADQSEMIDLLNPTIAIPRGVQVVNGAFAKTEGLDIKSASGLKDFQRIIFNDAHITTASPPTGPQTKDLPWSKQSSKTQKSFFKEIASSHVDTVLREDNDGVDDIDSLKQKSESLRSIQGAFAGADSCIGPFVEDSRLLLGMVPAGFLRDTGVPLYTCSFLPQCKQKFLDTQITAATFLLYRSFGFVPRFSAAVDSPLVREARERCSCFASRGAIVADGTGLGKTLTVLLALGLVLNVFSSGKVHLNPGDAPSLVLPQNDLQKVVGKRHLPSLIICPSVLVLTQWQEEIRKSFPDIEIIISAESAPAKHLLKNWVSSTQIKYPDTRFPQHLKYIFDARSEKASRTVILSVPMTHAARSLLKGNSTILTTDYESYTCAWEGRYRIVVLDEAHRYRHTNTKLWMSIFKLTADYHWMVTASPIVNNVTDIVGLLQLLWPSVKMTIRKSASAWAWLEKQSDKENIGLIEKCADLQDARQLSILNPNVVASLFKHPSLAVKARLFQPIAKLIMISRCRDTRLPLRSSDLSAKLDIANIMKPHVVQTLRLKRRPQEEAESQFWHMSSAKVYDVAMQDAIPDKSGGSSANRKTKAKFPAITAPLRKLTIASASTKLARLDAELQRLGGSSLVGSMETYRNQNHGLDWMIRIVWREADGQYPQTLRQQLEYMTNGSPLCRWLFSQYRDWVVAHGRKLLLIEDVPLIAWYWEVMSNAIGINTKVMYSSTTSQERQEMVNDFKSPDNPLKVLVLLYSVGGAQGTNLDDACYRALVMNVGLNPALEIQAWARLIRVSQKETVTILRGVVENSHSETREARQMDKSVVELATRTGAPAVQEIIVQLLNKYNYEVKEARDELSAAYPTPEEEPKSPNSSSSQQSEEQVDLISKSDSQEEALDARLHDASYHDMDAKENDKGDADYVESSSDESEKAPEDDEDEEHIEVPEADDEAGDNVREHVESLNMQSGLSARGDFKKQYGALDLQGKTEFDNYKAHLRLLARFDPAKVYKVADLASSDVLERGLRLLFRERYGMSQEVFRMGVHINYKDISMQICDRLREDMKLSRKEIVKKAKKCGLLPPKLQRPPGTSATPKQVTKKRRRPQQDNANTPQKKKIVGEVEKDLEVDLDSDLA